MKLRFSVSASGTDEETWECVDRHCHACGRVPVWVKTDDPAGVSQAQLCLTCGASAYLTPVRSPAEMQKRLSTIAASVGARPPGADASTAMPMVAPGTGHFIRFARGIGRLVQKMR